MDVTTALASLTQAFNLSKTMLEIRDDAKLNSVVIELQRAILAAQEQALEMQQERLELLEKIRQLENEARASEVIEGLTWRKPYYMVQKADGTEDGPYCQKCYDSDKKLIRLQGGNNDVWSCRCCDSRFFGAGYVSSGATVARRLA